MIRFQPDTLPQALLRFFDMAAPDANVYVEIPAPDIRFAAIVILAAVALFAWRRLGPGRSALFAMLGVLLVSTITWLASTGNGRYFIPLLVVAGPLAVGLVCALPLTRAFRATLAVGLLAGQAFVLSQQPPWNTWTVMHWKDGSYFEVNLGPEEKDAPPTTYGSLSLLTYSLIAPQFPAGTRWINLYTEPVTTLAAERTDAFLRQAAAEGPVKVITPSLPWASRPDGTPNAEVIAAWNRLIAPRKLRVQGQCRYFDSPGLLFMALRDRGPQEGPPPKLGFWTCPVVYDPTVASAASNQTPPVPAQVQDALAKLGDLCPRFFPQGEMQLRRLSDGWVRNYSSQTRAYVLDNGEVWYHFWRALNPVRVGKSAELLAGEVQLDCMGVRSDGAWRTGAR
ncbi:hypothetical protein H8N03_07535 [Ramlibacter sp. USB13]|uniref:Uncharacterized protein n=1 Tax=Ramlibacter cellulosilyticus TaxID=2764187 RepID=A0A923MRC5_9BURK|nr:hypothetical protein [Ramlibacter cellulosilyticus]MBC5782794.1 hypothetical protein [Ramlibacter cellulosilyticus]